MTEEKKVAAVAETAGAGAKEATAVAVPQQAMTAGILALVFALFSLLMFAIVFIPLALICAIVAIVKGAKGPGGGGLLVLGVISLLIIWLSAMNSPIFLIMLASMGF